MRRMAIVSTRTNFLPTCCTLAIRFCTHAMLIKILGLSFSARFLENFRLFITALAVMFHFALPFDVQGKVGG